MAVLGQEDRVHLWEGESVLAFLRGGAHVLLCSLQELFLQSPLSEVSRTVLS